MKPLLSQRRLAELLDVPESWVRDAVTARRLPIQWVGRHVRFNEDDILAWLEKHKEAPAGEKPAAPAPAPGPIVPGPAPLYLATGPRPPAGPVTPPPPAGPPTPSKPKKAQAERRSEAAVA